MKEYQCKYIRLSDMISEDQYEMISESLGQYYTWGDNDLSLIEKNRLLRDVMALEDWEKVKEYKMVYVRIIETISSLEDGYICL